MLKGFEWIKAQHSNVANVRGLGLLGAIQIGKASASADPVGPEIVAKALEKGLICRSVVYDDQDTLAFAPPFTITQGQMEDMITIIHESIQEVG